MTRADERAGRLHERNGIVNNATIAGLAWKWLHTKLFQYTRPPAARPSHLRETHMDHMLVRPVEVEVSALAQPAHA